MYEIDSFFSRTVEKQWVKGIEITLESKAHNTCALALMTYTEILGGYIRGTHAVGNGTMNFNTGLEYFGDYYVDLIKNRNVYSVLRSGLIHEGDPKGEFGIWIGNDIVKNRMGIEFKDFEKNRTFTSFSLREYFEEFKIAIKKYKIDLNNALDLYNQYSQNKLEPSANDLSSLKLLENFFHAIQRKEDKIFSNLPNKTYASSSKKLG